MIQLIVKNTLIIVPADIFVLKKQLACPCYNFNHVAHNENNSMIIRIILELLEFG